LDPLALWPHLPPWPMAWAPRHSSLVGLRDPKGPLTVPLNRME